MADDSGVPDYSTLPAKRMGAGAVIRDELGRMLIVEPTYKLTWEIPGGIVEAGESPRQTCRRELREELGIESDLGPLICVDYLFEALPKTEAIMFLFDGGTITADTQFVLPPDELRFAEFMSIDRTRDLLSPGLARRLRRAAEAMDSGICCYLEDGYPAP